MKLKPLKLSRKTRRAIRTTTFWTAIVSVTALLAKNIALVFGYEIPSETLNDMLNDINLILLTLSGAGILVNPKEVDSFQMMVAKSPKDED